MNSKTRSKIKKDVVSLGSLKGGDVFRYEHVELEVALNENALFMVLQAPEKNGVVMTANTYDGLCLARDKEHRVIKHTVNLEIEI
jgi:hypothetical protein